MRNHRDEFKKSRLKYKGDNEFQLAKDVEAVQDEVIEIDADVESMKATIELMKELVKAAFTFNSNGGSNVSSQTIAFGHTATEPEAPTKSDNVFSGWFSDVELTTEYSFDTPVTADTTVYAKWVAEE